jgi:hypothetical protein
VSRILSRDEELEEYLKQLRAEAQGVGERIAEQGKRARHAG